MQLIITVLREKQHVETVTLDAPKEASFGRQCPSGLADKQFRDEGLSRQHFRICPEGSFWRLEDLRSRNGTKVNDKPINVCLLKDGDEIKAGKLRFLVGITGQPDGPNGVDPQLIQSTEFDPDGIYEVAVAATRGKLKIPCTLECGESGQTYFRGEMIKVQSAAELLLGLRQTKPFKNPWLIVDESRLETPLPESLADLAVPIVDWLGPQYAESTSPRLINLKEMAYPEWESLVGEAWGQDTVIVLFSNQSESDLLQVLRKAVRHGTAISGVLWPSVLSYMLLKARSGSAVQVISSCSAILMELPDLPDNWLLVGPSTVQKNLEKLGMVCTVTQGIAESPTEQ